MKRTVPRIIVSLLFLVAACSGDDADDPTTTAAITTTTTPVTSLAAASSTTTTTTVAPTTSVTTTVDPDEVIDFPEYTIVSRVEGDSGDTIVVLLGAYDSLTDIDLHEVLVDVVDRFPPVLTAYVVDDASAVEAVLATSPTEEQLATLDSHYLVRLEEGFRMVFTGKFADTPIAILGS